MDPLYGQRSTYPKKKDLNEKWVLIDGKDQVMGRLVSKTAQRLLGKHRPDFQPGALIGDKVIITNADKIIFSGNKTDQKKYYWHTGFLGGIKSRTLKEQMDRDSAKVLMHALKGMLPKNKYGNKLLTRVRIFSGEDHGMEAQKPETITLR